MAALFTPPRFAAAMTVVPTKISASLLRLPAVLRSCPFFFATKFQPVSEKSFQMLLSSKRSQKFIYPDPDPEFALAETQKFKIELVRKLSMEKGTFGNELDDVIDVCAEIFHEFLRTEYGGPGTLLVEPFTNMMVALKEKNFPGAPSAARASLIWAQNFVDQDWDDWKSVPSK